MERTTNNTKLSRSVNETVKTGEVPLGPEKSIQDVGDMSGRDRERKVTTTVTRHQETEVDERQIDDPVTNFMMSLGIQDNVNLAPVRPGAEFVWGDESSSSPSVGVADEKVSQEPIVRGGTASREDTDTNENTQSLFLDHGIEAHLAPSAADEEARIVERLEAEIMMEMEERMIQSLPEATVALANHDHIVIADEVTESPTETSNKRPIWLMVSLALLMIVGGIVGGVLYARGRDHQRQTLPDNTSSPSIDGGEPSIAPSLSMAPSAAPFVQVPLNSLLDELSADIAPTDGDLLIVNNVTSPQGKALGWLQDDLITRTPGRSTSTVLERYALAVLYYSTSGESSWSFPSMNNDDVCNWNMIDLVFNELRMEGSLPWEVILLSNLKSLNINRNKLSGPIPSRIGELTRLSRFLARRNKSMGTLPERFSPATVFIEFEANRLTGTLTSSWGDDDALTDDCQSCR